MNSNQMSSTSRPGTGIGARPTSAQVPRFVEKEKQVLRFYAHFFERKRPEAGIEFRRTNTTHEMARLLTMLVYLEDETVEIHEEKVINSGPSGFIFFSVIFMSSYVLNI